MSEDPAARCKQLKKRKEIEQALRALPKDLSCSIVWDSDGDFLITNLENREHLSDLFCKLKEAKSRRVRDDQQSKKTGRVDSG